MENINTSASMSMVNGSQSQPSTSTARKNWIYMKLAEDIIESDAPNTDSDRSSLYDSVNEMETDEAKDSSDYSDGYVGYADTAEFEYEVDDLSSQHDIESQNSSSGVDDAIGGKIVCHAESNDLKIFTQDADLEESDGQIDAQELRHFYKCMQCKHENNDPLYRYCQKCYQMRKTHFPPRPKHRRKRSSLARRKNSLQSNPSLPKTRSAVDDIVDIDVVVPQNDQSFMMEATSTVTIQSTVSSDTIDGSNSSNSQSSCASNPNSQETDTGALSKCDSLASTVSAFALSGLSQLSNKSNFNEKLMDADRAVELLSLNSDSTVTTSTSSSTVSDTSMPIACPSSPTVSSTQRVTKRNFQLSHESNNDAESMVKRTKLDHEIKSYIDALKDVCIICLTEPKNSAFVHSGLLHACCCYRCAIKVWNKQNRCPVCNLQVNNVLKLFVH